MDIRLQEIERALNELVGYRNSFLLVDHFHRCLVLLEIGDARTTVAEVSLELCPGFFR